MPQENCAMQLSILALTDAAQDVPPEVKLTESCEGGRHKSVQATVWPSTQSKAVQACVKRSTASRHSQTKPHTVSIGIQVGSPMIDAATQTTMPIQREAIENENTTEDEGGDENYDDEDYSPCEEFEEKQGCVGNSTDDSGNKIFLVQEKYLWKLFQLCTECLAPRAVRFECEGTLLKVYGECASGHLLYWCNQDIKKQQPMLNVQLCAAVLFSGSNPTATLRMLASIGVPVVSNRTFFTIQRSYLWPAIDRVWKEEQKSLLQELQGQQVNLAGDGRSDSPGFSAKYGTYTLMDVERHKVLHFEVVQSNDAGGSCRMELEGLKQGLAFLESANIKVAVLVTDRHTQIKCFLRNNKTAITHEFDVWTQLAALHYNENSGRGQARTKDGTLRWCVRYPKAAGGDPTACPVKEPPTHGYVKCLLDKVVAMAESTQPQERKTAPESRPPLSSSFPKVPKEKLVEKRKSRFNRQ
ncbi:uncharacterized protein LOC144112437 [Amblyomma americanum]